MEILSEFITEKDLRDDTESVLIEYRHKIHEALVKNLMRKQRQIFIYVSDFEDEETNKAIEEIFRGVELPLFESRSVTFIHKPSEIPYDQFLTTLVNSSEKICFTSHFNTSSCESELEKSPISSLPKMIFDNIPSGNNKRDSKVNMVHGNPASQGLRNETEFLDEKYKDIIEEPLKILVEGHIRPYIEVKLSTYNRYQAEFLEILVSYAFRSPLNFIMIKHDYKIFIHEYLRCETKLKFGYNFIKESYLVNYNVGNLVDSGKSKLDIGIRFLQEKDSCKARVYF